MMENGMEGHSRVSVQMSRRLALYGLFQLALGLIFSVWFAVHGGGGIGFWGVVYLVATAFGHAILYMLPVVAASLPLLVLRGHTAKCMFSVCTAVCAIMVTLLLLTDVCVLQQFGFHINGLVINLLLTPGGFASMGLDRATLVPAILGILVVTGVQVWLVFACLCGWLDCILRRFPTVVRSCMLSVVVCLACLLISSLLTGVGDFFSHLDITSRIEAFPIDTSFRMRTFLGALGFQAPPREKLLNVDDNDSCSELTQYPLSALTRKAERRKYNIVWLVGESLRGDYLSAEIMPATMGFSADACRFENHYSGGHATRYGVYTMFYGLYGLNWNRFLSAHRSPVLMDWLRADDYQFLAQTSAHFTYPEFDKTVFVQLRNDEMREISDNLDAWKRDEQLVSGMIEFIQKRDTTRPFFTFAFFEAPHAPYSFPESAVIRENYMKSINYATVSKKDAEALYNRGVNAAHFLDGQLARIYGCLAAEPGLLENTIVIVTGDHGEEFYENGRLGHTSSFVKAQLHVPLVLRMPGVSPRVVTALTCHVDLVPTLAEALGIENPASDYSVGQNLLSGDYRCEWFVACGWKQAVLVNPSYKYMLPISVRAAAQRDVLTHFDDTPCSPEELEEFKQGYSGQLFQAQQALTKFIR